MDAGKFLELLWGDPPPGQALVWMLPQKVSNWYQRFDAVSLSAYADRDIYTGVGLAAPDARISTRERAKAADITAIAGMWADIDVAGPEHSKPRLPETLEAAQDVLDQFEDAPTIIVHSGHGIQAWWLFEEPWVFDGEADHDRAEALSRWWYATLSRHFNASNYILDATPDLSRLMRLPGTVNNKSAPVAVEVSYSDGPRYDRADMLTRQAADKSTVVAPPPAVVVELGPLILSPDAEPPAIKFGALIANDPKFRRSFNRQRPDMGDQSASAYDMSLATIAVSAGWSDQEVTNLLIAGRRENGNDLKLRERHYQLTLIRARAPGEQAEVQARLEDGLENGQDAGDLLADLSQAWGIPIDRFIRWGHGDGKPHYELIVEGAENVVFPEGGNILSQVAFRNTVAGATGIVIPSSKPREWDARMQVLLRAVTREEVDDKGGTYDHIWSVLLDHLTTMGTDRIFEKSVINYDPFTLDDGTVGFWLSRIKATLLRQGENYSGKEIGLALRRYGAIRTTKKLGATTKSVWLMPPDG